MTYVQLRSWGVPKGPYVISRVHTVSNRPHGVCPGGSTGSDPSCHLSLTSQTPRGHFLSGCHRNPTTANLLAFTETGLCSEMFVHFQLARKGGGGGKHFLPLKANARKQYAPLFLLQIYILDYYHLSDPDKWNESLTHQNSTWNNQIWQKD